MTIDHIRARKPINVTLKSSSTVNGVTTTSSRTGVAGAAGSGGNGSVVYNAQWKMPRSGVIKNRKDVFQH